MRAMDESGREGATLAPALSSWQGERMGRDLGCGEVRPEHVGRTLTVAGWVHRVRDLGGLRFVEVRDRTGRLQLVINRAEAPPEVVQAAEGLRAEFVVAARGTVRRRAPEAVNPRLATGEVELVPAQLWILATSKTPPFELDAAAEVDEGLRLRYRYLDLRRPAMFRNLWLRHRAYQVVRRYFDRNGFLEVETPMLTRSTPEGARDYLVPSRLHPGRFYALPQSPQLFKQLLMVGGIERYFQIVRCFRDEDLRADRQPEFTQIDVEMSFVDVDDVLAMAEGMMAELWQELLGVEVPLPLPRLTYAEAMARYGSDKPDLRYEPVVVDVSDVFVQTGFRGFQAALASGGAVRALRAPGGAALSRKELDALNETARAAGSPGVAWIAVPEPDPEAWRGPVVKFFTPEERAALAGRLELRAGDLVLLAADEPERASVVLGKLRLQLAERLAWPRVKEWAFTWVVDFPLLEWDEEEQRYVARHHPFTSPRDEDLDRLESDPAGVRARAYDLVLNGYEIGGGSIRIHRRDVQERVFRAIGLPPEKARERFGFLLEAFDYGPPPHGGIAFGFDRIVMLAAGASSIRDVIAFPKTARAVDPLTGAPAEVDPGQLEELHLRIQQR
ncbi:aspartate--tRNA ligase [Thermaerobacter subterraneus]|uniref:Aspartate--tRNA ligase n=1 Tax=Thermaerobacter subterraneus DSM 13965 TaxID=867903 RepID=K6PYY2_9FIRM|nr:aspartate--tRNA ligase [Thermaerobacter subterraneus]EKP93764.1 aspartyl-tRNA synthetase [Thermaerobacter subterraneus DSM 13965]